MHISWLGGTTVKLQTRYADKDVTVVIDPYKPETGSFPRSLAPDVVLFTRGEHDAITLSGKPFVFSTPGECETNGVLMSGVSGRDGNGVIFRIDAEDISIGHMGLVGEAPNAAAFDMLTGVDVLFVPVGSKNGLSPEAAQKAVSIVEPRIVIPIAFKSDNDPKAETAQGFLREIGASPTAEKKIIVKKKDLPQDETKVVLLEKE